MPPAGRTVAGGFGRQAVAFVLASLTAAILVIPPLRAAGAEFSAKDGQVLGRTLGFVGDGMSGLAVVGVVFSPADPASCREAELIRAVIGDDMPAGRVLLRSRLVPIGQVADVTGLHALYVTGGLMGSMDAVWSAARRLHVPTISADIGCIQAGACVVGFSSEPTVQIVIDRGAAERSGVHFLQAFRMLVREK
nr:hypothetical protein [uncultured Rhodopila sp.]